MITALCRTVILYFLIMIGLRLMGKRQIGELEPSELVLTMMISDLATVPMQDFGIPLLAGLSVVHGLVPPHPGPLLAIGIFHADIGKTIFYGLLVALPTAVIAEAMAACVILDHLMLDRAQTGGVRGEIG